MQLIKNDSWTRTPNPRQTRCCSRQFRFTGTASQSKHFILMFLCDKLLLAASFLVIHKKNFLRKWGETASLKKLPLVQRTHRLAESHTPRTHRYACTGPDFVGKTVRSDPSLSACDPVTVWKWTNCSEGQRGGGGVRGTKKNGSKRDKLCLAAAGRAQHHLHQLRTLDHGTDETSYCGSQTQTFD